MLRSHSWTISGNILLPSPAPIPSHFYLFTCNLQPTRPNGALLFCFIFLCQLLLDTNLIFSFIRTLQVGNGPHRFTYDHVFGGDFGQEPETLYGRCVAPLVDGLFKGYNATVSDLMNVFLFSILNLHLVTYS
jgi:hypothetical protein